MIRVALKGLAGRKFRASLTALAIVLGVAMVSGTYIFTDTITKGFDTIFAESFENADAVISGKNALSSADESTTLGFPADVLARVSALPEVEVADGAIVDEATLIDKEGRAISSGDSAGVALSVDPDEQRFNPLTLIAGAWPRGARQIAIDRATADNRSFAVGDSIRVVAVGPARRFRITGIAEFGSLDSLGGATIAVFDVPTAQQLFDKEGKLDEIQVVAKPACRRPSWSGRSDRCCRRRRGSRALRRTPRRAPTPSTRSSGSSSTSCSPSAGSRSSSAPS